jgi:hypothetical protein
MTRSFFTAALVASSVVLTALSAHADDAGTVSIVRGQFTDKVENRLPGGDATTLAQGKVATYWVEVDNPGETTDVILVWKLDGKETARQTLEVGHSPKWRTWGMCSTQKAHTLEVEVLDKDGHQLKTDSTPIS